jgi:galactokinase
MNARQKDSFQPDQLFRSGRSWSDLARGAIARVAEGGRRMPGLDLMVEGDLPIGEGLASSAAYLVAILRSVFDAVGVYRSRWELAEDVPAIERAWVDVACGPMDPYVVAAAKPGQVLHVDCRELDHEILDLPAEYELVAEDTGIRRTLSRTPYNERRRELELALAEIRTHVPDLRGLCDLEPDAFLLLQDRLGAVTRKRARHVVTETARVRAATDALDEGDMQTVGALMVEGHRSLSADFESSLPEIDALVDVAIARPSILGARLQGAGWGGRLVVLQRKPPDA